jgi:hypothetical protein
MAQFQSPINYVTGDQVTAANLNNHINGAVALPGLIADQSSMSANDVASTDQVLINDGGVLKKTTVGDVLNSNLTATFTSITATNFVSDNVAPGANKDLGLSPNAGVAVTGKTFTSVNGINVTVNSTAHNVLQNQVLTITASIAAYSGEYRVVSVTTDTFEYVLPEAATPNSGSCDYTKTASVVTTGNSVITSDEYLIGNQDVGGNSRTNGNSTINGNLTVKGTANFTGAFQVNGTVGYVLTEIVEQSMASTTPAIGTTAGVFTSTAFTKPSDEIWVFEVDYHLYGISGWGFTVGFRYNSVAPYTGTYQYTRVWTVPGNNQTEYFHEITRWVAGTGTTFTAETVKCDTKVNSGSNVIIFPTSVTHSGWGLTTVNTVSSKFRIYKYKTA